MSTNMDSKESPDLVRDNELLKEMKVANKARSKVDGTEYITLTLESILADMAKRSAELLKLAKEQYQPRLCPFCKASEALSNQDLVEIYRGSTPPDFSCNCEGFVKEAERISIEQYLQIIAASLPDRFKDCTLDNYIGFEDVKFNLKQSILNRESVIISGTVGTGKTHLAIACLKEFLISRNNRNDKFIVTSIPAVLVDLFANADALKPIQSSDILILDDLGMEAVKEWGMEKIFNIVNYRYEAMLPIIVTTNLTSKELKDKIGQRSFSRIMSMCKSFVINGDDYRLRHLK